MSENINIDNKEAILYGAKYEDSSFNQKIFYKIFEKIKGLEARIAELEKATPTEK